MWTDDNIRGLVPIFVGVSLIRIGFLIRRAQPVTIVGAVLTVFGTLVTVFSAFGLIRFD